MSVIPLHRPQSDEICRLRAEKEQLAQRFIALEPRRAAINRKLDDVRDALNALDKEKLALQERDRLITEKLKRALETPADASA